MEKLSYHELDNVQIIDIAKIPEPVKRAVIIYYAGVLAVLGIGLVFLVSTWIIPSNS